MKASALNLRISEKAFQAQVVRLAQLYRWAYYHTYNSQRSVPGYPDLTLVRPPRLIFAELKTESGKVTPAQQTWFDLISQCEGVEVYIWRPSQFDEIVDCLSRQ
jgi:hypothetical protein